MRPPERGSPPRRGAGSPATPLILAALAVGAVAVWSVSSAGSNRRTLAQGTPAAGVVTVEVNDQGFSPSWVPVAPGIPVDLEFRRTTTETCASSVVFPELGVSQELALNRPVRIHVPASQRRTLSFQCGVGNHRSAVIIN